MFVTLQKQANLAQGLSEGLYTTETKVSGSGPFDALKSWVDRDKSVRFGMSGCNCKRERKREQRARAGPQRRVYLALPASYHQSPWIWFVTSIRGNDLHHRDEPLSREDGGQSGRRSGGSPTLISCSEERAELPGQAIIFQGQCLSQASQT